MTWIDWGMLFSTALLGTLVVWWYTKPLLDGGVGLVALFDRGGAARPIGPIGFLRENDWLGDYGRMILRYWGARVDTLPDRPASLPLPLLNALAALSLATLCGTAAALIRRGPRPGPHGDDDRLPSSRVMVMLLAASFTTAVFYSYADYRLTRDLGGHFGIRGQYFLPPIIGQMAWLLAAVMLSLPRRWANSAASVVGLSMVALTTFTLIGSILPHAYGWPGWFPLLAHIGMIQSVPPWVAAAGLLCAGLAPTLAAIFLWSNARRVELNQAPRLDAIRAKRSKDG